MVIGLWPEDDLDIEGVREQLLVSFSVDELKSQTRIDGGEVAGGRSMLQHT